MIAMFQTKPLAVQLRRIFVAAQDVKVVFNTNSHSVYLKMTTLV